MAKDVVIIGAGVGGLSTAIQLARNGYKVKIFEKNNYVGGRCGNFEKDGFRFDIGATLLMMPDIYKETYRLFGREMHEELDLFRMDPIYNVRFAEGQQLTFSSDLALMQQNLEQIEKGSYTKFLKYMSESYDTYQVSMKHIIDRNYYNAAQFFNLKNLFMLLRMKAFKNHYKHTANYFDSELLRIIFTFQNIYVGQNPFSASAIFAMLPFIELTDGVWFPKGGMHQIAQNFMDIARENHVSIEFGKAVKQIVTEGHKTTGIRLDDETFHSADIVVANADVPYVYNNLLHDTPMRRKVNKLHYTCSAFMFHWGVNKIYPQLEQHNVFVSPDYKANIDAVFERKGLPELPSFYVHAPVRTDITAAPNGKEALSVIVPVGHIDPNHDQNWDELKEHARKSVIERLKEDGLTDIDGQIAFEVCYTPKTWSTIYNVTRGSVFGSLSHNLLQMGYMRPSNQHKKYRNLFFVGGSTHPGNGVPMVLLSSKLTTEKILRLK